MFCPRCSHEDTKVIDSRLSTEGTSIRRRRACESCGYRFTTYEKEEPAEFQVQKKDGSYQPYLRQKALQSMEIACQKRRVSREKMESILAQMERQYFEAGERIIATRAIGDAIMLALRELDEVAYVRFASVYKAFKDADAFVRELRDLDPGRELGAGGTKGDTRCLQGSSDYEESSRS